MTNISSTSHSSAVALPPNSAAVGSSAYKAMTPDAIIAYVESSYSSIDGQIKDFQDDAVERNKVANEWRSYKKLVREYAGKDGTQFPTTQPAAKEEIARINAEFAEFNGCTDPELKKAVDDLKKSVLPDRDLESLKRTYDPTPKDNSANTRMPNPNAGSTSSDRSGTNNDKKDDQAITQYTSEAPREAVAAQDLADWQPKNITKDAGDNLLKTADESLQTLNQSGELTLMHLNELMQQRQQITTSASKQLDALTQCTNSILQNMR